MATKVRIDQKALAAHLRTPAPQAALDFVVQAIQDRAEELAPVGGEEVTTKVRKKDRVQRKHTVYGGYYKRRFSWRRYPLSRRLRNTDFAAHWIEWGSQNNPAYAPMRRAALSLGLRFTPAPKGKQSDGNG